MRNFLSSRHRLEWADLAILEVKEDLSYKGPIDKFIPDDMKAEIREIAGLKGRRYDFLHRR